MCGRQGKQTAAPGGTRPPETPRAADGWSASTAVSPGPGPARPTLPSPRRPPQPRTQPSGDPCRPLAASRQLRSPRPGPAARPSPHQPASCSPHGLLPADTRRRPRAVTSGARGGGGAAAHAGRWPREQGQAGPPTDRQTRPPIGGGGAVRPANRMRRRAGPAPLSLCSQSVEERGAAAPQCSVPIAYCPLLNARLPADRLLTAAAPLIPGPRRYSPERIPCHSRSTTRRRRNCLIRAPRWAGCGRDVTPGRSGGGAKRGHAPRPLPRVAMAPGGVGAAGMRGVPTGPDLPCLLGFRNGCRPGRDVPPSSSLRGRPAGVAHLCQAWSSGTSRNARGVPVVPWGSALGSVAVSPSFTDTERGPRVPAPRLPSCHCPASRPRAPGSVSSRLPPRHSRDRTGLPAGLRKVGRTANLCSSRRPRASAPFACLILCPLQLAGWAVISNGGVGGPRASLAGGHCCRQCGSTRRRVP